MIGQTKNGAIHDGGFQLEAAYRRLQRMVISENIYQATLRKVRKTSIREVFILLCREQELIPNHN